MTLYGEGSNASSTNKERPITELWGAEKLILQNEKGLRRSDGSGMLISDPQVRGEMLALPTASSGERRNHPRNERELRRSDRSGTLIGDPRW